MTKRGISVLLIFGLTIALGALAVNYQFDQLIDRQRATGASVDRELASLTLLNEFPATIDTKTAERQAVDQNIALLSRWRLALTGAALLFLVGLTGYFGRAVAVLGARAEPSTAQMFRELPPPVKTGATAAAANGATAPAPAAVAHATPHPPTPAPAATSRTSITAAAELCVDLARAGDADDLPGLLERAALVLDARGIVFWAADSDGARLRPSLSHGYSQKILSRLGVLQVDADNVTSRAYRSLQPQALNGASVTDAGAIAIPLLAAGGCVGVMAAELRHNRPHADLLPVARILGAQFSTLIAAPDTTERRTARA